MVHCSPPIRVTTTGLSVAATAAAAIPLITSSEFVTAVSVSTGNTGVDLGSLEQQAQRGIQLRGTQRRPQIYRVAAGRRGRNCLSQLLFRLGPQRHDVQAGAAGGVRGENARTTGIADHCDAVAAR